jgi:hypothetical protein
MTDGELKALLESQKADALSAIQSSTLSSEREDAMDYYLGNMAKDMPTQDGRSKAVSSDVSDTVEGLMPSLMDIFAGSDEVVRFEAVGPEDEEAAQQESDYVNHVFMNQNPGFMILYEFIKDCLLQKTGIVKVWWDEREEEEKETYLGLQDDQFALLANDVLQSDGGLEIIEHDEEQKLGAPDPMTGQPAPIRVHNVTLLRTKDYKQAKVLAVAPEEFGIERNARTIKECNYCFHKIPNHTEGQLIAQGYDPEQVKSLPSYTLTSNTEETSRNTVDEQFFANASANRAARPIEVVEHYVRMDYKGDGKPCLYKVTTAGGQNEILIKTTTDDQGKKTKGLDIEEFDAIPFAAVTPIPQPHRFFGLSVADQVMPIQRINTALLRGLLDNTYMVARPRIEISEAHAGPNTIDDLLTVRDNGVVRTKAPGGLQQLQTPSIVGDILPVINYMDGVREMRTGVTRQGQGVDADALQNQSATAVKQVFSATQARMKLIARIIAETGVRDMFSLLHATIRKHGQEAATVKLRNQWVSVDPRNWKTRNDMTINVGLGTGGKAEQFAQTMALANFQKELLLGGKSNIVDDVKLYNTAAAVAKLIGHKNPDQFFNNPMEKNPDGSLKYPPPQAHVDPKLQIEQMKQQGKQVEIATKAQADERKSQLDAYHEQVQAAADMEVARFKAGVDAMLAQLEGRIKLVTAAQEHQHREREHQLGVAETVFGMAATAHAHDTKMEQMKSKPAKPNA